MAVYFCFSRSLDGCKNTTIVCHFPFLSHLLIFSVINDQPLVPNDFFFTSLSFLSRSKTRTMSAERADKRAMQAMQCCGHGYVACVASVPVRAKGYVSRASEDSGRGKLGREQKREKSRELGHFRG